MFKPDKVLALNNAIGLLVVAAMPPGEPDVEALLGDFRLCLNDYDAWAENYWMGWALDVEQVFTVGDEVRLTAPKNLTSPVSSTIAACPASGPLTLVHMFEAARFVPIGDTPVMLEQVIEGRNGEVSFGEPIHHTIGPSGILEVSECWRGDRYRITFFPHVSKNHVKALYASYQDVTGELERWLRNEWATEFQPLWAAFSEAGFTQRYGMLQRADWHGFEQSLNGLWDDVKQVYALLADLQVDSEKLLEYLSELELETLLKAPAEAIAKVLLVLSDEPLMFIHLAAFTTWLRMLPPQYIAEVVAEVRTEVLISFLLARLLGPAGLNIGISARVLKKIKSARARQWLAAAGLRLAELSSHSDLTPHAAVLKPLMVNVRAAALKPSPVVPLQINAAGASAVQVSNPVAIVRNKSEAKTRLGKVEHHDNAPDQAKNPNGDAAEPAAHTATNKCPVSMVTGEELLTLVDAALDGILPFEFTRLYRTSAVEIDSGLGFGWSHSLAHRLEIDGDSVVWIDHENRRTTFPLPSVERPAIHNSLSRAAIYRGDASDELIVAQAGEVPRFYHFHHGQLTAISNAYDNRLCITRDRQARIQRLDNGAGRALRLRYDRQHVIAVDYQVFVPADNLADAWRTEQTLVSYRYDACHRLIEASNAVGESERYDYDDQHVILQRQLAGGASFFWAWEKSGKAARCVRHWASFAQMEARYVWDDAGGVVVQNSDGSEEVYQHDERARLVRRVGLDGGEQRKAYDDQGRLIAEQDALGAVTEYRYDEVGRLEALIPPEEAPTSYEYRNGFLHARTRGNAVWTYRRNAQGDVTEALDPDGQVNRLIRVRHSRDQPPESFAHDPAGNLLMQDRPGPSTVKGNRLQMQGDRHYDYDAFGNLIRERRGTGQKLVTEYRYDCQHRLVGVTTPDGRSATYRYDAFGRRIRKTVDGQSTQFFWQGDTLVAESGREHYRSYIYEPGTFRPLAMLDGKGPKKACPFYYQLDHLGTPQELTDYSGEIVWSAKYSAYGRLIRLNRDTHEILDQPLRFQGQYFDPETGLHYNRNRYYQPDVGRYLTPDPTRLAGGINPYQYTRNPTGWVDPLGLDDCPGTGKCRQTEGIEDPAGKAKVDEGDASLPYAEEQSDYLYRGDLRRPEEIFSNGFVSRGKSTDLLLHVWDNQNPPSNFVSTSTDIEIGIDFGTKYRTRKGYLYTLKKIEGRDVNKELPPSDIPYSYEDEIAIPDRVRSEDILGATPLKKDGSFVGHSIPNPRRQ